jgi:hypothetical protein
LNSMSMRLGQHGWVWKGSHNSKNSSLTS